MIDGRQLQRKKNIQEEGLGGCRAERVGRACACFSAVKKIDEGGRGTDGNL